MKPKSIIDALSHFYLNDYGTVHRGAYTLSRNATELYAAARVKMQKFLNASFPEEIIFTRGSTDSLNLIAGMAKNQLLGPGDVVLISEIEHHANIVSWQMAGVELRIAPVNDQGDLDLDAFAALLDKRVKLVSIAHVSNVIGTVHPIETIVKLAHANGSLVVLDGAQSAPHMPIDLKKLNVDFFVCSGHKLYGPTGIGILYGKKAILESLSPVVGGGDMIDKVTFKKTTFAPLPLKFEAGTPPFAEAIALGSAIDYLTEIGLDEIAAWETQLTNYALKRLNELPFVKVVGSPKERAAIISFTVEGMRFLILPIFWTVAGSRCVVDIIAVNLRWSVLDSIRLCAFHSDSTILLLRLISLSLR